MQIGFWQIIIIVLLVVLLFGRGKISDLMGDVAKGIKNFKKGIEETPPATAGAPGEPPKVIDQTPPAAPAAQPMAQTPATPAAPATPGAPAAPAPEKKVG